MNLTSSCTQAVRAKFQVINLPTNFGLEAGDVGIYHVWPAQHKIWSGTENPKRVVGRASSTVSVSSLNALVIAKTMSLLRYDMGFVELYL